MKTAVFSKCLSGQGRINLKPIETDSERYKIKFLSVHGFCLFKNHYTYTGKILKDMECPYPANVFEIARQSLSGVRNKECPYPGYSPSLSFNLRII